jgi:hypothetical protein
MEGKSKPKSSLHILPKTQQIYSSQKSRVREKVGKTHKLEKHNIYKSSC